MAGPRNRVRIPSKTIARQLSVIHDHIITELVDNVPWDPDYSDPYYEGDFPETGRAEFIIYNETDPNAAPRMYFQADDFTVPFNKTWYISEFYCNGFYSTNLTGVTLQGVQVNVYADNNTKPNDVPFDSRVVIPYNGLGFAFPDFVVQFNPVLVINGTTTVWISIAPILVFNGTEPWNTFGLWYWFYHYRILGYQAYVRDFNDSFSDNPNWTPLWTPLSVYRANETAIWFSLFGEETNIGEPSTFFGKQAASSSQPKSSSTAVTSESSPASSLVITAHYLLQLLFSFVV